MSNPNVPADHPDNIEYYYSQTNTVKHHINQALEEYASKNTFSTKVSLLTELWLEWMKQNAIANNEFIDSELREQAANKCEELITREYQLTEAIDEYFNG